MSAAADTSVPHEVNPYVAVFVSLALTTLVLLVMFPHLWYQEHAISDIPIYQGYAQRLANGERPFTESFKVEYPPLAIPLFRLPGHVDHNKQYRHWFSVMMGVITLLAAAVTTLAACRFWPRGGRAYVAGVLFAVSVAFTGAIIINRYDAAVALLVAGFLLCLANRWYTAAAFVLGIGFALKFTPAAMLPLVLILVGPPRRWVWPVVAFSAAAAAPFLPYVFSSPRGMWYVFHYYLARPLQVESVLGTPLLIAQLLHIHSISWASNYGSQQLIGPGAPFLSNASGALMLLGLAGVYYLIWRRRDRLRASTPDQAIAVLALILALMTFGKVLSPQYFIWTLPTWVLVAARDRVIGVVGGLTLVFTQAEFPKLYWVFLDWMTLPLLVVIVRNLLLVAFFALAAWQLWGLPEGAEDGALRGVSTEVPPPWREPAAKASAKLS
jgi:hypothetical protein